MAIPPDPIEEIIGDVDAAVIAHVTHVLERWTQARLPAGEPGQSDVGGTLSKQKVRLRISEVLFGDLRVDSDIEVIKPDGDYLLSVGHKGPFLLGASLPRLTSPTILGRYGPDSYRRDVIVSALAAQP